MMITKIIKSKKINDTTYDFWLDFKDAKKLVKPGQFVHIKIEGFLLRRPISICEIEENMIRIVFEIRGDGTKALSTLKEGDKIDLLAPLGNGFSEIKEGKKLIVVGGGIGTPPLLELSKRYGGISILGFKSKENMILREDFEKHSKLYISTDDGSYGHCGFTTDILEEIIEKEDCDIICSCGPHRMLENVCKIAKRYDIDIEVSLEERMACGVGACLVCQCMLNKDGKEVSKHVCSDGPVFNGREVRF